MLVQPYRKRTCKRNVYMKYSLKIRTTQLAVCLLGLSFTFFYLNASNLEANENPTDDWLTLFSGNYNGKMLNLHVECEYTFGNNDKYYFNIKKYEDNYLFTINTKKPNIINEKTDIEIDKNTQIFGSNSDSLWYILNGDAIIFKKNNHNRKNDESKFYDEIINVHIYRLRDILNLGFYNLKLSEKFWKENKFEAENVYGEKVFGKILQINNQGYPELAEYNIDLGQSIKTNYISYMYTNGFNLSCWPVSIKSFDDQDLKKEHVIRYKTLWASVTPINERIFSVYDHLNRNGVTLTTFDSDGRKKFKKYKLQKHKKIYLMGHWISQSKIFMLFYFIICTIIFMYLYILSNINKKRRKNETVKQKT